LAQIFRIVTLAMEFTKKGGWGQLSDKITAEID
jgi:hypothetical protein